MKNVIVFVGILLFMYVFYKIMVKEPILPWKEKKVNTFSLSSFKKEKRNKKHNVELEQEPELILDLFEDIEDLAENMLVTKDYRFIMMAEVEPVNYFLLSQEEQEAIDVIFERWLAQINYPVQIYLQNRLTDLTEAIEEMEKNMSASSDLSPNAMEYGRSFLEYLQRWQTYTPRYETKRYLIFYHQINPASIQAADEEELKERLYDKAFAELYRRFNTAKSQLRKAYIDVHLLSNEGITEVLYHALNRHKAVKNRFRDIQRKEMLSLYVTADQDDARIEAVKSSEGEESYEEKEAI
ncbi:hypothetical protein SAMN05192569_103811 [Parageobacillus thermantarcticus]|uniref:Uncharacterized protein n=1 Tax=Parageobacillus thermantarcticus TaxID=186116 RepID=A0A1I0TLY0_9BACL|nr:hypothetical protein [Parageobacillus thermantarcticus]SFA52745.1 hypothetical protein SAMN05192569_103811 [Parageobacillus thermantarcticus]